MKVYLKYSISVSCLIAALGSLATLAAEEEKITEATSMELILFNPELREVMAKHVPDLMSNPEIDQASVISLGELAGYVPDQLTGEVMKAVLEDLNKVAR